MKQSCTPRLDNVKSKLMIMVIMGVTLWGSICNGQAKTQNIVINGSFEAGKKGWRCSKNFFIEPRKNGKGKCLKAVGNPQNSWLYIVQNLPVKIKPGQHYTLTVEVSSSITQGKAWIGIRQSSNKYKKTMVYQKVNFEAKDNKWQQISCPISIKPGAENLQLYIALKNVKGFALLDNINFAIGKTALTKNKAMKTTLKVNKRHSEISTIIVKNNPSSFVMPEMPAYYQAQDLNAPAVKALRIKVKQILRQAKNPDDELNKVITLCNWVAVNMSHPYFNKSIKRRVHDPKYDTFSHDPVKILEYTEKFMPFNPLTWPSPECTQQNDVLIGMLNCIGLHGRVHNIPGHVAAEYYSPTFKKWVYIDATFNELFTDSRNLGIPLSTLEMIEMAKNDRLKFIVPMPCGDYLKEQSYMGLHPKGITTAFMPKMWMATFDLGEKNNRQANMIVFGANISTFMKPYPKAALVDSVDFPLGLIRFKSAILRGDGWAFIKLENCIPHFSHYEYKTNLGKWKRFKSSSINWNTRVNGSRKYRGVDNAGNCSPAIEVIIK